MTFVALIIVALIMGCAWFILPWLLRRQSERHLQSICSARRALALTYDDGPGDELTPRLLDLFDDQDVRASFYVLGRNARDRPDMLKRLKQAGHDIGSHTFAHSNAWRVGLVTYKNDVIQGAAALGGSKATAFRPPFGKLTIGALMWLRAKGLPLAWWTIDSKDSWDRRPAEDVVAEVVQKGGGVVLMHDADHYDRVVDRQSHPAYVLELTQKLIEAARENDITIIPQSELLN